MNVKGIVCHLQNLNMTEPGLVEQGYGLFPAPHHAQPPALIKKSHRHAVHEADRI